ncbi:glycoside hydrolase family 2 protein [Echinicola sediminis]
MKIPFVNLLQILILILTFSSVSAEAQDLPFGFPDTNRSKRSINQDWKFYLGKPEARFFEKNIDDSAWEDISVPHTLALTSLTLDDLQDEKTQLAFHRNVGWYRKTISVPEGDQKVFLEFEGAHQITDLWVNGLHVGKHRTGGYTPFHFDITDYVKKGAQNQLTLLVDNRRSQVIPPDPGPFDYVKFSGLYRDVYLVQTDPVHVGFNWESRSSGVAITTPTVDPVNKNATLAIKTSVKNEGAENVIVNLITRVIDADGLVVLKLQQQSTVPAGQTFQFDQIGSLEEDVQLWSIETPYLYRVNSVVEVDGKPVDFVENTLGIRTFSLDPEKGFMLNGEPIELIGFNRHQHYPYIGDAVPDALHYKDMLQFKEFGFNVMRTAHYPQDDAILDACDRLGILVYEEAPSWIDISKEAEWWDNFEQAARVMIRNHRNHPSMVIWGAGINHRGYVPRMHNTAKQEDPVRLTASQGARWTGWQSSGLTDINANMLYGPFIWDRSEPMFAMEGRVGAEAVAPFMADPKMTGLISWTAHAYYTFHPTHDKANDPIDRTRSGAMTVFRYPRPETFWYKAELRDDPFIYLLEDWCPATDSLTIYSNAEAIELSVNGKIIAEQTPSNNPKYQGLDHPPFHFRDITYQEGELKVKGIFNDGNAIEITSKTPGKAHKIKLEVDTVGRKFTADGSDILMAYAKVVDKEGTVIRNYKGKIEFSTSDGAHIVGSDENINANPMFTEYGVAPVLIRAGKQAGEVIITARAKGLQSDRALVKTVPPQADMVLKNAQPIYDFKKIKVDIGAPDQLVQFGWDYWNGSDEKGAVYALAGFEHARVQVSPATSEGIIRWLGEMNVIGKYGFVYGDGLLGIDSEGLNLTFEGLPKGNYQLTTWHHAPKSNSDEMDPNKEKLKSIKVLDIPYERMVEVKSMKTNHAVNVTEGKEMQFSQPGKAVVEFSVVNKQPVTIKLTGTQEKGIWLNGLELSEWYYAD